MPYVSFLDPSLFELEYVKRMVEEIEDLVAVKEREVNIDYKKWQKENEHEKLKNEDYYYAMEDTFANEMDFISEFSANIFNGLAVTINTTFETRVKTFVREMAKTASTINYDDRHTYKMSELLTIMKIAQHPNSVKLNKDLLKRLRTYTDIRNSIVHHEGRISSDSVKSFIINNKILFKVNEGLWIVSVKADYIRKVVADLEIFFKLMAYKSNGEVIFF